MYEMCERRVLEPRPVAAWLGGTLADLPPRLEDMRAWLSLRPGVEFDSVRVNLYCDGVCKTLTDPVVATVSLGRAPVARLGGPGPSGPGLTSTADRRWRGNPVRLPPTRSRRRQPPRSLPQQALSPAFQPTPGAYFTVNLIHAIVPSKRP